MRLNVVVLLLVYATHSTATSCRDCTRTYETDKSNSGTVNAAKCTALAKYLTCLETSSTTDTECPLTTAQAADIQTVFTSASCGVTGTCACQQGFWKTDPNDSSTSICSAAKTYISCLKGKTTRGCDGSSSAAILAAGVQARMSTLANCSVNDVCQCEINAAKADISTEAKKCSAYKAQYACLYSLEATSTCNDNNVTSLAADAVTSVTSIASCTFDDTCLCQRAFNNAQQTDDAEKCTAYKHKLSCLATARSVGCNGTIAKRIIGTVAGYELAALNVTLCPESTFTCKCEMAAAKGDSSSGSKYCNVLSTLKTCLGNITGTIGCNDMTKTSIATAVDMKIQARCASCQVTFAMTSLLLLFLLTLTL